MHGMRVWLWEIIQQTLVWQAWVTVETSECFSGFLMVECGLEGVGHIAVVRT